MHSLDDYGYRYDRRLGRMDALDHVKRRWKPNQELIKHVRKLNQNQENEKSHHFHVDHSVFWEYFHFNKRSEYRIYSKWAHVYHNKNKEDSARTAYIYAAFNKSGDDECKLKFAIKSITKLKRVDAINDEGFRIISSKPVLRIDFGECVEAVVSAKTMNNIVKQYWKKGKNARTRVYNFDSK